MTDKEKILKYIDYKGISKNKFYVKTGLSVGFLDSGSSLGVDKLRLIVDNYHDLSLEWMVTGKGDMIKNENNHDSVTKVESITKDSTDWEREYYKVLRELNECLKKNNELLEDKSANQAS